MFTLINTTEFPALRATARLYRHDCGMQVLSLETADPENLFSLCFSTVPTDNTGVPHIIEHSVLEGSRAYPVKDPFVCMLKTSVATFINAMTYPDRTIYPCTSCCRKDYFNLFEVYWDAVFHPELSRQTFAQEGWHYELKGRGSRRRLVRNGIVLNEMSGYYSDPGTILGRTIEQGLFGRTPMCYDSGGEPASIPRLTYRRFLNFHRQHYNPAVTKVVLYGDIPTADKLAFIESHLQQDLAERGGAAAVVANATPPPPMTVVKLPTRPRTIRRSFVPDQETAHSKRGIFALAWALDQYRDPEFDLAFQLLEAVLFGSNGAPLRRAIQDSRLCSSIMVSGYDNETRYTSFQVAMRGVRPQDFDRLEKLVMGTLQQLAREGIPREFLEAALADFLVSTRSVDSRFVIDLLDDVCAGWMYGDDPYLFLRQYAAPEALRQRLEEEPEYLEDIIRNWLLANPARLRVELTPDRKLQERTAAADQAGLARTLAGWSPAKVERTRASQTALEERALREDTPQALDTLPKLHPADLEQVLPPVPWSAGTLRNGQPLRRGELFANGISAATLVFDASTLAPELQPWFPFFAILLNQLGDANYRYDQLAAKFASLGATYAISGDVRLDSRIRDRCRQVATLKYRCLDGSFAAGLELLKSHLDSIDFNDRARLTQCLREAAALAAASLNRRESALTLAAARAAAGVTPQGYRAEQFAGVDAYRRIRQLNGATAAQLDELCARMAAIAAWMRQLPLAAAGFVGDDRALASLEEFAGNWPRGEAPAHPVVDLDAATVGMAAVPARGRHESARIPTQISTCVRILEGPHRADPDAAPATVGFSMLSRGYMWDEIRAKGGAYGAGINVNPQDRRVRLFSTDDPNPAHTREAFDAVGAFIAGHDFTAAETEKAILTSVSPFFRPFRPAGFDATCAWAALENRQDEERQEEYQRLLAVTAPQVREALLAYLGPDAAPGNDFTLGPAHIPGDAAVELG